MSEEIESEIEILDRACMNNENYSEEEFEKILDNCVKNENFDELYVVDVNEETFAHYLIASGNTKLLNVLLSKDIDSNVLFDMLYHPNKDGERAFHYLVHKLDLKNDHKDLDMIKKITSKLNLTEKLNLLALKDNRKEVDGFGENLGHLIANFKDDELLKILFDGDQNKLGEELNNKENEYLIRNLFLSEDEDRETLYKNITDEEFDMNMKEKDVAPTIIQDMVDEYLEITSNENQNEQNQNLS